MTKKKTVSTVYEIGLDGWPIDPNHPANQPGPSPQERRRRQQQRIILQMKGLGAAWLEGNVKAAPAAVKLCRKEGVLPPLWLSEAVEQLAQWHLKPPKKRQGQGNSDDEKHARRWDLATSLMDNGRKLEEALHEMVDLLEGTADAGGYEAMRSSYRKVQNAIRNGGGARFFVW